MKTVWNIYRGTKFLHLFQTPFEKDKMAAIIAKRDNLTVKEVLDSWDLNAKNACTYGTQIHALMENYIKNNEINEEYKSLYESFDDIIGNGWQKSNAVFLSEQLLYNDTYQIAGTADLIIDYGNDFAVGDFKTNKSFNFYSKYGTRFKKPLDHLSQCEFNLYGLQLSLYAYFYGLLNNKKCRNLFIMYKENDRWTKIPCHYMELEIRFMLEYYKNVLNSEK